MSGNGRNSGRSTGTDAGNRGRQQQQSQSQSQSTSFAGTTRGASDSTVRAHRGHDPDAYEGVSRDVLDDLPPSGKFVYYILQTEGAQTHKALQRITQLPGRSVRNALDQIDELGLLESRSHPRDARQDIYRIEDPKRDGDA